MELFGWHWWDGRVCVPTQMELTHTQCVWVSSMHANKLDP